MDKEDIGRRKVLALLAAGGVTAMSIPISSDEGDDRDLRNLPPVTDVQDLPPGADIPELSPGGDPETNTPEETQTTESNPEIRLEDFGGVADGETDDTDALLAALDAATPDRTIHLPEGDVLIGQGRSDAVLLKHRHRGVTIAGAGPGKTQLKMASGHNTVHRGIIIAPGKKDRLSGITIRDLTFDGQGLKQNYNIANGIEILDGNGTGYPVEVRNCVIRNWATNGFQIREPGTRISNCSIVRNGLKQEQVTGRDGHGVASSLGDIKNQGTIIEGCLIQANTGAGADNGGGDMTIRNCVIDECGYGVKQNETTDTQIIENTRISNLRTEPGIYNIPQDHSGGDLILNTVVIENATDPGILFPAGGSISGDRILIRRTNTEVTQPAEIVVTDEGRTFDIGELLIYEAGEGAAMYLENCTGSIDRLVHDGNGKVLDESSDVDIETILEDDSVTLDVPTASDVGATGAF